jgi:hypothetical protein
MDVNGFHIRVLPHSGTLLAEEIHGTPPDADGRS